MSSTTGLSTNGSNGQSYKPAQLDASTREGILARSQARILSAIGVVRKDEYGGGGLNPLKGLYSAAAATFLKNKQGQQSSDDSRATGSYEKAADILKKLGESGKLGSSTVAEVRKSYVSGPASGGNYKRYAWSGSGVTGSDPAAEPAAEEDGAPAAAQPADLTAVYEAFTHSIEEGGGNVSDQGDGTTSFKVMDITGSITQETDKLVGRVESGDDVYTFEVHADGGVVIDASQGNTSSVEFDQLKHLLSGSMSGARTYSDAPSESGTSAPEDSSSSSSSSTGSSTDSSSESSSSSLAAVLTTSVNTLSSLLSSGSATDNGRYNAKLLVTDIQAAGGVVAVKDSNTLVISLNGQSGEFVLDGDSLKGSLGTGSAKIDFVIRGNGELSINGNDSNATALASSRALRQAMGATLTTRVDFDARVAKYNRYGTGLGLNLLG